MKRINLTTTHGLLNTVFNAAAGFLFLQNVDTLLDDDHCKIKPLHIILPKNESVCKKF